MRSLLLAAAAFTVLSTAARADETWIAACLGENTQFTMIVGGNGFFHVANDNRTYDTQKLVQSFYNGTAVCAVPDPKAPAATSDVALVCADKATKMISVLYRSDAHNQPARPASAVPYCKARIDVLKQ